MVIKGHHRSRVTVAHGCCVCVLDCGPLWIERLSIGGSQVVLSAGPQAEHMSIPWFVGLLHAARYSTHCSPPPKEPEDCWTSK